MKQALEDLQRRISELRARFDDLGARAASVAQGLVATLPPELELIDELGEARHTFADLRAAVLEEGDGLVLPDAETILSLQQLDPVLATIVEADERRARQAAWEAARETALTVLDRVIELVHREESGFAPLAACQAKARELHLAISASTPDNVEEAEKIVSGRVRPFAELVTLIDSWDVLDDDRCAFLQDAITQSFGRPLALAALRGKLGREGDAPVAAPEPRIARRSMQESAAQGSARFEPAGAGGGPGGPAPQPGGAPGLYASAAAGEEPPASPYGAPTYGGTPAYADASGAGGGAPAAGPPPGPAAGGGGPMGGGVIITGPGISAGGGIGESGSAPAGGRHVMAPMGAPLVVEIRLTGDKVQVETAEERREKETQLEALAAQTAHWWITARAGWAALRERRLGFADAVRETVQRFPYLLSVPIQASTQHEGGALAEGYALLLEHVEKLEPGFVKEALMRLNPQFTTRAKDQSYPLGQELYLYVVAEGRLYKTYPDFLKEVLLAALPEHLVWTQGTIKESNDKTQVVRRGDAPGSSERETASLTDENDRTAAQAFAGTIGPLTARFFTVEAGELEEPRDVEVKLKENDTPSDRAWLVTLPPAGQSEPLAPRRHKVGGTTLPDLGKTYRALWIAVFNPDPNSDKRYELTLTVKRKPPPPPPPGSKPAAAPAAKASPFAAKRRPG
ncbi:MAG TPA: hypothetical protein VGU22_10470 [Methylomirabilota bacterium]|nr:hypothetical protein [Methylomirabilota bacterium]